MGIILESFVVECSAAFLILYALAWYFVRHSYGHWQRKGLYFVPPVFPFGNYMDTILQRQSFGDLNRMIYRSTDQPVLGIWRGFRPTLFVRDPNVVQHILIKDFNAFQGRGLYCNEVRDPLSGHLISLPGDKWRPLRAKLSPSFTAMKLKAMFSTFVDCGSSLDAFVDRVAEVEGTIEIRELVAGYTTNIIASVAFGIETDCIADPETAFRKYGRKIFEPSIMNGMRRAISFLYPQLMHWSGMRFVSADVEQFIVGVVKQNMDLRENHHLTRRDFFQMLVQLRNTGKIQEDDNFGATVTSAHKSLSIEECAAQTFVFFAAGFETSSATISFAVYELAKNRECMREVQNEINQVLARHKGEVTYDSVSEMKYLDWCIDETLRLYPPVPALPRECNVPWTIPNTDVTIDAGTAVIIPVLALHQDPRYWPEPEKFNPERFSRAQSAHLGFVDRPYLPFGAGPRNCIGMRLGKMTTKLGLIVMLHKYNYELAGISRLPMQMSTSGLLLAPVGGINVRITHRNIADVGEKAN